MAENRIFGCIGRKLGHSYSVPIHALLADYEYKLIPLEPDELEPFFTERNFSGINVTIPYKQEVMKYLDFIDSDARRVGAVNTVVNRDGKLYGYNTDVAGLEKLLDKTGIEIKDKKVLILGTGGTSKTAAEVCRRRNAKCFFKVSRGGKNEGITYEEAAKNHKDTQVIINCTPVGMYPADFDECPVDTDCFPCLEGIADAIYNPLRTSLVQSGENKKIKSAGGLYMLVMQAAESVKHFIGEEIPDEKAEKVYQTVLNRKRNIVLTGMPTSGKTAIGKLIAEKTGREFADTDELIVKEEGREIKEIFSAEGEEYFRNRESEIIRRLSSRKGLVIATGGGSILRGENVCLLKSNGIICLLDRPVDELKADGTRPLSSDANALSRLYAERYDIYRETCDRIFEVESFEETADSIIKELQL